VIWRVRQSPPSLPLGLQRRLPRALAPRRHDEILRQLGAQGSVGVAELAGSSVATRSSRL